MNEQVPTVAVLDFLDVTGKHNDPAPSMSNAHLALAKLGVECSYDVFHDRRFVAGIVLGDNIGQVSDDICLLLRREIRKRFKFDPGLQHMWDAINLACRENTFHPVLDYLDARKWDSKQRIETWLIDYAGAPDTPFIRAVSRLVLVASVRRMRSPGCKFDYMTVLESGEGKNKSLALATLYGDENFSDQSMLGIHDKEIMELGRGRWGWEAADLSGMRKADVDRIKAQLSRQSDRGRPSYGRAVVDVPRTYVSWGTTNDQIYLRSQTGNRRFWPVPVTRFDIAGLIADRDQLWAEANAYESWGEDIGLPETLWRAAGVEQEKRTHRHPWELTLANISEDAARTDGTHYQTRTHANGDVEERVTSQWVLGVALGIQVAAQTPDHWTKLAGLMRKLGWDDNDTKTMRIGGVPQRGYKRLLVDLTR